MNQQQIIRVIDSHTAGEPTRVIVDGAPVLQGQTMAERRQHLRQEHDWLRSACICEPRGHDALVGALLCEPLRRDCVAGIIFFNNVGYLHGCIHGTIGVAATLLHQGRISLGNHGFETPVGVVTVQVDDDGAIAVRNIRSFRHAADILIDVPGYGRVCGDVAWGGNWFFLIEGGPDFKVDFRNLDQLTQFAWSVRQALAINGITGEHGAEIDHIELFGPPKEPDQADSKNFVLCPGKAYDRSPCGTGTSAKLACLYADGRLHAGQVWRQAGILDTVFEGRVDPAPEGGVFPTISGRAYITAEADLVLAPADEFRFGIRI